MNCIIAQSGGPTSVINASVYGLVKANKKLNLYENVYGGLNGIEGILNKKIINLSDLDELQLERFKNSPASGLGSCRYKLKPLSESEDEYLKLLDILNSLNIKAFFYVGGNDSMDTTAKLNAFAKAKNIDIKGSILKSFFTINAANIPSNAKFAEKLSRKYPYTPNTSINPAMPPIAPLNIIVNIIVLLELIPT